MKTFDNCGCQICSNCLKMMNKSETKMEFGHRCKNGQRKSINNENLRTNNKYNSSLFKLNDKVRPLKFIKG